MKVFFQDGKSLDSWTPCPKPLCHGHPTGPHLSGLSWTPAKGDSTESNFTLRRLKFVNAGRGAAVERALLVGRGVLRQVLEGVPQLGVAAALLVGREVALEHAAVGAERLDAGLDVGAPGLGQLLRRGRCILELEAEAERGHAEPAELHVDVGTLGELGDALLPRRHHLGLLAGILADAQRAA